jgi:hypothetical protein
VRLFACDDWAEDHHDIEVMDEAGKVLARRLNDQRIDHNSRVGPR